MAAELRKEAEVQVELVEASLGEFNVSVDDRKVVETSRLWYPRPGKVIDRVRASLAE